MIRVRAIALTVCSLAAVACPVFTAAGDASLRIVTSLSSSDAEAPRAMLADGRGRLYVATSTGMEVVETAGGSRVGSILIPGGATSIALASDEQRGFVGQANGSIAAFDVRSLATVSTFRLRGHNPVHLHHDAARKRLYVVDGAAGALVALDDGTGRTVARAVLGGDLRQASSDGRGQIFVSDAERNVLHVVDAAAFQSRGQIDVWPGQGPSAMAHDTKERRIYVACANGKLIVVDPDPGQMIAYVDVKGSGVSGLAMEMAPARLVKLYLAYADGGFNLVQNAKLTASLAESSNPGSSGTAVAFDAATGKVFLGAKSRILVLGK